MEFKDLIFVTGKGGTGKTTWAICLAHHLAQIQKKRVLLVELASRSSVASLLALSKGPFGYVPQSSGFGFDLCLLQGMDCLVEYLGSMLGAEKMAKKVFEASVIRSLVNVAPGLNDLAVLGKLTSHLRRHGPGFDYDHIVVDAPSTGSFYSLIQAPQILGKSVSRGPLKLQSDGISQVLKDADQVQYFVMSLFEEFASDELEDTLAHFTSSLEGQLSIVVNQHLTLDSVQGKDPHWQNFIRARLEKIRTQTNRIKDLWETPYGLELMTQPLPSYLSQFSQGDLLRKL